MANYFTQQPANPQLPQVQAYNDEAAENAGRIAVANIQAATDRRGQNVIARGQTLAALTADKDRVVNQQNANTASALAKNTIATDELAREKTRYVQDLFYKMNEAYANGDMDTYKKLYTMMNPKEAAETEQTQALTALQLAQAENARAGTDNLNASTEGQRLNNLQGKLNLLGTAAQMNNLSQNPEATYQILKPTLEAAGLKDLPENYDPKLMVPLSMSMGGTPVQKELAKNAASEIIQYGKDIQDNNDSLQKIDSLMEIADKINTGPFADWMTTAGSALGTNAANYSTQAKALMNQLTLKQKQMFMPGGGNSFSDADRNFLENSLVQPRATNAEGFKMGLEYLKANTELANVQKQFFSDYKLNNPYSTPAVMQKAWTDSPQYKQGLAQLNNFHDRIQNIRDGKSPATSNNNPFANVPRIQGGAVQQSQPMQQGVQPYPNGMINTNVQPTMQMPDTKEGVEQAYDQQLNARLGM